MVPELAHGEAKVNESVPSGYARPRQIATTRRLWNRVMHAPPQFALHDLQLGLAGGPAFQCSCPTLFAARHSTRKGGALESWLPVCHQKSSKIVC